MCVLQELDTYSGDRRRSIGLFDDDDDDLKILDFATDSAAKKELYCVRERVTVCL